MEISCGNYIHITSHNMPLKLCYGYWIFSGYFEVEVCFCSVLYFVHVRKDTNMAVSCKKSCENVIIGSLVVYCSDLYTIQFPFHNLSELTACKWVCLQELTDSQVRAMNTTR